MLEHSKKMFGEKRKYREQMARVELLPEEYRFVFEKIQEYIWSFAGGDGLGMLETQRELLDLFEVTAAEGKHVLEVTGEDVAGFCDEFIRDTKKWTDTYRGKLNQSLMNKLGEKSN